MKDLQILWAACKYHWRRFTKLFKEHKFLSDAMVITTMKVNINVCYTGEHIVDGKINDVPEER